jgi:heme ABC exporter ATP-binding subunit CcmA
METADPTQRGLAVSVRDLWKRYGYREILRGVALDVPVGTALAILGPNGVGKSTLLRILAGQARFDSGSVNVCGRDVRRDSTWIKAQVGVVFHESFLRREFTLEENLRFTADLYRLRWTDVALRVDTLLRRLAIHHRKQDRVGTFSQGLAKRASLVRSLLHDPRLWILDEPFSGLDPAGRDILEVLLREFTARGGAVVVVTHATDVGPRIGARSVRLDAGRMLDARQADAGTPVDGIPTTAGESPR